MLSKLSSLLLTSAAAAAITVFACGAAAAETQSADQKAGTGRKEIAVTEIENILIGQYEDAKAGTGCTVLISRDGMPAGLDVRGGGPASRESELLKPTASADRIHAVVLGGGSAYGLGAADGVMRCLEENGIGYDTGYSLVPLVCQSDIFDLGCGRKDIRPDSSYGYQAAKAALAGGNYRDGNYGCGCGATVGKWNGMKDSMKSGIGSYAVQIGDLKIGAIVCVNALGDIFNWKTGEEVAGLLNADRTGFQNTVDLMVQNTEVIENKFTGNTTIGIIITNGAFNKTQLCKLASMAHNGYAQTIRPVHTSADGDSIYAVSVGNVSADSDLLGTIAAEVMSEAILRAVQNCDSAYGFPAAKDLKFQKSGS